MITCHTIEIERVSVARLENHQPITLIRLRLTRNITSSSVHAWAGSCASSRTLISQYPFWGAKGGYRCRRAALDGSGAEISTTCMDNSCIERLCRYEVSSRDIGIERLCSRYEVSSAQCRASKLDFMDKPPGDDVHHVNHDVLRSQIMAEVLP